MLSQAHPVVRLQTAIWGEQHHCAWEGLHSSSQAWEWILLHTVVGQVSGQLCTRIFGTKKHTMGSNNTTVFDVHSDAIISEL